MKIRNRITLWITASGLVASLLFSLVVSYEMIEQPYDLLDEELDIQAHTLISGLEPQSGKLQRDLTENTMLSSLTRPYWIKIFNEQQELIYASDMVRFTDLPLDPKRSRYTVSTTMPAKTINLEQDDNDEVAFRVRIFTIPVAGHSYLVQIARPIEKLDEEIFDLLISLLIGLACSAAVMVGLGYYVSGRILKPISAINSLAREITDKTLDKRIPLGKNRDELYELSSSLNHMFDRLQYSFQHQKEFLANASHELKTPIAMQRLFFDEALQLSELPDNFRKQLVQQSRILCRMDRLVKNLLDLSALELQAACDPEELDLVELTATVFTEFEDIIRANNIELSLELPGSAFIRADGEKIKRVLINLIDNAIKYNHPEEGRIECRITTENKGIWLEIYNSGPGIPADQLERVFDQFYRVEKSRSTALGGAGLGLTIVKRIIEMHGGTITMESEAGSWTRVRVFFPTLQTDKKRSDSAPLNA